MTKQSGLADNFSNFNVRVVKGDGKAISLSDFVEEMIKIQQQQIKGFEIEEKNELKIDGNPAYYVFFSHERGEANMKYKVGTYMIVSPSNQFYIVTFTMTPTVYERLKPTVKASALTIKLVK